MDLSPERVVLSRHPVEGGVYAVDGACPIELGKRTFAIRLWAMCFNLAQEDGQHLHCAQHSGGVVILNRATIFLVGNITTVVVLRLDAPVASKGL